MGQATADLPDPLETQALGNAPSADDLLAQMATDEIDRLLADADGDAAVARDDDRQRVELEPQPAGESSGAEATLDATFAEPVASTGAIATDSVAEGHEELDDLKPLEPLVDANADPELAKQLDSLFEQLNTETGTSKAESSKQSLVRVAPEAEAEAIDPQLDAQLDALFGELEASNPKPASPAAPAAHPTTGGAAPPAELARDVAASGSGGSASVQAALPAIAAVANDEELAHAAVASPAQNPELETGDLARQVLAADVLGVGKEQSAEVPALTSTEHEAPTVDGEERLPFYLWPLALLSAPLERFGDGFRQVIGKIAITTLVNALAVLLYVLIFRR